MSRLLLALGAPLLLGAATAAQDPIRIDFGSTSLVTATTGWNDVHTANLSAGLDLVDATGAASGVRLDAVPGKLLLGSVEAGTSSPTGALAALGWPASAYGDAMWNDLGTPEAELSFSGLDPTASYDFTLTASRTGVGDVRTGRYTLQGFNAADGVLDAANNASEVLVLSGIVPDLQQRIALRLRADATNTNPNGYYYLGGVEVHENPGGASGPLLAFGSTPLAFSRQEGKGPFSTSWSVATYDGATPAVTISAVDDATGSAPTWLAIPSSATAGTSFTVTVDESVVPPGAYSATLTARAAGYPDAVAQVTFTVRPANGALNLLFYGNSYSQGNGTLPVIVAALAETAGHARPFTQPQLVGGQNLFFHLTNPAQAAAITTALPLGESWDFVVMQGFSTEATHIGDPAAFVANAEAILANVKAHSPDARCVLFQTWARGQGHGFYPGSFSGPLEMHREIEASYTLAADNMNARWGPDTARRAAAGETAALFDWVPFLYEADLSHPAPPLSLLAGMAVFAELYQERVCDLTPDFASGSLASWLSTYSIDSVQWEQLVGVAERVATEHLRRWPGSGDDLILRHRSVLGVMSARPRTTVEAGATVDIALQTPNETVAGAPAFVHLQAWPRLGSVAAHPLFPELVVDPTAATALLTLARLPAGAQPTSFAVPPVLAGTRFLVQGYVLAPSYQTGNAFVTTDAHELVLEPQSVRAAPPATAVTGSK